MKLPPNASEPLTASQIADLRLAASKMHGAERRAFQAEMALKYCQGSPRLTETVFGWGRENVTVRLAEKRTGSLKLQERLTLIEQSLQKVEKKKDCRNH